MYECNVMTGNLGVRMHVYDVCIHDCDAMKSNVKGIGVIYCDVCVYVCLVSLCLAVYVCMRVAYCEVM